jgi:hypothetical protein
LGDEYDITHAMYKIWRVCWGDYSMTYFEIYIVLVYLHNILTYKKTWSYTITHFQRNIVSMEWDLYHSTTQLTIMKGNCDNATFFDYLNEMGLMPYYIDYNGWQPWQCHLLDYLCEMGLMLFHHTLTQVKVNHDNAPS